MDTAAEKGRIMTKKELARLAAEAYKLSQQQKEIDKKLKDLKGRLKEAGSGQYGEYVVSITEAERESFKLKDAKSEVSASVWNKIKGFVSTTAYQTVRVVKA